MFMYRSINSYYDGYEGVGIPSIVLYGVDLWVIFGEFFCNGLFGEYVIAVCEFYELYCSCGGWCQRCTLIENTKA